MVFKKKRGAAFLSYKENMFLGNYEHISLCVKSQISIFLCLCDKIQVSRYHLPSLKHHNRKE